MFRTVFAGSPSIAATILDIYCKKLPLPLLVLTQPAKRAGRGQALRPTKVSLLCERLQIPVIPTPNINSSDIIQRISALQPDLILVAAFGQMFKKEVLSLPTRFCLNVHASLLPKYRGAAPVQWAILQGERETGITMQKMDFKLDAGPILLQRKLSIMPDETSEKLLERMAPLAAQCLIDTVEAIEAGVFTLTPQNETQVTFAPKIEKTQAEIDWSLPAERIRNQIRALQPWPVAETTFGTEPIKIYSAIVEEGGGTARAGDIVTDSKTFFRVRCGDGRSLNLLEVQLRGKKRLGIHDFLLGYRHLPRSLTSTPSKNRKN